MKEIKYIRIDEVDFEQLTHLMNDEQVRKHLVDFDEFNTKSIRSWVRDKLEADSAAGCKIRAIEIANELAGWCGIQFEDAHYEIAIVLSEKYWGIGKQVFLDIMDWAKVMNHSELVIRLLDSRREYKFLAKMASNVYTSEIYGRKFTTYSLPVS